MKKKTLILIMSVSLLCPAVLARAEMEYYDGVIAVVNGIPIIYSDIIRSFKSAHGAKKLTARQRDYEMSRILDNFVADAIVFEVARNESILVSDERVVNQLEGAIEEYARQAATKEKSKDQIIAEVRRGMLRRAAGVKETPQDNPHSDQFINQILSDKNTDFRFFFEELRNTIRRELVMSISIGVTPPSREEAQNWYKKNISQVGFEIWAKHILIRPKGGSFAAEKDANDRISQIRRRVMGGESFEAAARANSEDRSTAAQGGDLGWTPLHAMDILFAQNIFALQNRGQISPVFKSSEGYHIAMYMGRRPTPFEKVERIIMYKLYQESVNEQFQKWVNSRKSSADIRIHFENYMEAK